MHIFDIRRSPDIIKTWRDIQSQSELRSISSGAARTFLGQFAPPGDTQHVGNTGVSSPDFPSEAIDVQSDNLTDARRRWIQHCGPPQLHTSAPISQAENDAKSGNVATGDNVSERNVDDVESDLKAGSITEEGRRQVRHNIQSHFVLETNEFNRQKPLAPNCATPVTCLRITKLRPPVCHLLRFGALILRARRRLIPTPIGFPCGSQKAINPKLMMVHCSMLSRQNWLNL